MLGYRILTAMTIEFITTLIGLYNHAFEQLNGALSFIVLVVYTQHEIVFLTMFI